MPRIGDRNERLSPVGQVGAAVSRWRAGQWARLGVAAALLAATTARADVSYPVTVERNVAVRMRDGVTLRADIYRPSIDGKFPVLLERTPYEKSNGAPFGVRAAAHGYVVIYQDTRGRYASEGAWMPFRNEANDGYDTIEWAAALPASNGQVGTFGGSYPGAVQLLAATARPPHLAGICPIVAVSDFHENWVYQGGAFEEWFNESWTSGLIPDTVNRTYPVSIDPQKTVGDLPLADFPVQGLHEAPAHRASMERVAPYYRDWIDHPNYDDYWRSISIERRYADIAVPALHIAAWYDVFLQGSLRNYVGIKASGANDAARRGQRLIVAAGGHAGNGPRIGARDFGPESEFDEESAILEWYDYLFKGVQNAFASDKPVRIFVLGANKWRAEDAWPLARATPTRYYLHSGRATAQGASGPRNGGTLSRAAPGAERPDRYQYDPRDAAPTLGGPLCCGAPPPGNGPQDQRPAERRADVLSYTTAAFDKDTEVTGPVSLELYVSSTAVDTDFTGMLVDVWPDGFAQNLTSGILRMRYRNSVEKPELASPGKTYRITVDLWATSNVFLAGHKMRLEVSSSNFPRFDRNLNTGEEQGRATRIVTATNSILHDSAHPSALIVPIVR